MEILVSKVIAILWHFALQVRSHDQLMGNYIFLILVTALICPDSAIFIVFIVIKYDTPPLQNLIDSVMIDVVFYSQDYKMLYENLLSAYMDYLKYNGHNKGSCWKK